MAGANMKRNQGLAGQSVKQGGYTVTYDDLGYATKAIKDNGKSATSTVKTEKANNSTAHQKAYQAAQKGDWDAVGAAVNEIAYAGGSDPNKGYDFTDANKYMQELQDQFKYNARDYYDKQYDKTYGAGSSAVFDATGGAVKTADQWNQLTGGAALPTAGSTGTASGNSVQNSGSYAYQYIRDMYEQQAAAQLAALKSTYEQNVADSKAYDDLISASYQNQKNQAAAQNDLQRMYMNELGIMQGLNTGTTGQMALAQSAALQGNMAQIGVQEAQSLSDNALERQKLAIAYRNAVNEAEAEGNYQLASALYQEYVRQDNLAQQKAAAALEQQNWLDKFNYQKEQDALAQQNWQAQFDYQKQQDALDRNLSLQKLYAANQPKTVETPVVENPGTYQVDTSQLSSAGRGLWNIIKQLGDNAAAASGRVQTYLNDGRISEQEADIILKYFGY